MFTGIIETTGTIKSITREGSNIRFSIHSGIAGELKVDQSVSHNGVCMTVVAAKDSIYETVAIEETLKRSNLGSLSTGSTINLERSMKLGDRLDGHLVQGHVDTMGTISSIEGDSGSKMIRITHPVSKNNLTVEKGSVCVNGVSLTVVESNPDNFTVAIIPYTWENTNFQQLHSGDKVNLEFDVIGKYVARLLPAQ